MIAEWSSNSGYSLLCVLRALAQTISYEVTLAFILLSFVILICRYNLVYLSLFLCHLFWFISCLAETESELVSGFSVEYGGAEFAIIFWRSMQVFF